jgi:Rod binding domain-containing protein
MTASLPISLSTPAVLPPAHDAHAKAAPKDAGKAFEGMFASMLIKQMRQTLPSGQGLFGHDPGDVLGGLFDHFMSQYMAEHGSLGIGAVVEKRLARRSEKT